MLLYQLQIVISFYEVYLNFFHPGATFQPWAKHLIVINSLLCTINSSCNFAFYCGDVVFRECLSAISKASCNHAKVLTKCLKIKNRKESTTNAIEMETLSPEDKTSPKSKI